MTLSLAEMNAINPRYDLNALFKKQMGFMTVNVQGLSRVSKAFPGEV